RLLVLLIGVNNTWDLDQWVEPSLLPAAKWIEEGLLSDVEDMVRKAAADGIAVALCSILPTDIPALASTRVRNELVVRVNAGLLQIAARHGATYVDYHARMAREDGLTLRPGLADDGLHPHLAGYRLMACVLLDALAGSGIGLLIAARFGDGQVAGSSGDAGG
ncbi:MAG: hypothetical protein JOZ41_15975, partial [Chloroflexi bacterium]|nr:hypothetical protein [Chloroflexota bacterium]